MSDEDESVPNQHATEPCSAPTIDECLGVQFARREDFCLTVSLESVYQLLEERKQLREALATIQRDQTLQLTAARAAAFEMAARVCDGILEAREIPADDFDVAEECSNAIRLLAKTP